MNVEEVDVGAISCHPKNARKGNVEKIVESIRANGFYNPLIVQRSTGFILAGNHRYLASLELGMKTVPVVFIECDDRFDLSGGTGSRAPR